jgi:hypothetical protein
MPIPREEHEAILNDLLNPELEHSKRTELLQLLRVSHSKDSDEFSVHTQTIDKLTKDNADLVISNSKLFRQIGVTGDGAPKKEEVQKEFSETITLEQIEKGQVVK